MKISNRFKTLLVAILFIVFVFVAIYFRNWTEIEVGAQLFAALAGAAVVAVITQLLLISQSDSESIKEQNVAKFKSKLASYNRFLDTLNKIVEAEHLSEEDEADIQFQLLNVNLHTSEANELVICKNLNSIIRKLKVEQPLEPQIWRELYEIENVFHNELYQDKREVDDTILRELNFLRAPQKFREIDCTLAFLHDSLSLLPERISVKRIGFRHINIIVPILPEKQKDICAPHFSLTVFIQNANMEGAVYLSTSGGKESLQKIIDSPKYLHYNREQHPLSICQEPVFVGTEPIDYAVELFRLKASSDKWEYLHTIYLLMDMLYELWWRVDEDIIRRNPVRNDDISVIQIKGIPSKRANI